MISVGGVEWTFNVRYLGKDAAKQSREDLVSLKEEVRALNKSLPATSEKFDKITDALERGSVQLEKFQGLFAALSSYLRGGLFDPLISQTQTLSNSLDALSTRLGLGAGGFEALTKAIQLDQAVQQEKAGTNQVLALTFDTLTKSVDASRNSLVLLATTYGQLQGMGKGQNPLLLEGPGGGMTRRRDRIVDVSYTELAAGAAKAEKSVEGVTKAIDKDKKAQREKHDTNKDLTQSFDQLTIALSMFLAALGADKLFSFIKESTILAGRVESLGTVMENVGSMAGHTRGGIALLEQQITSLGITLQEARHGLALLAQGQIDLANGAKLARLAQDAAVIAGINSSEAYERIVQSIQRTNTFMLRSLGILINLNNVYRDYAMQHGRVVTTLSTHEKQQAMLNAVMEKGAAIAGTYEASLADAHKRYTSQVRFRQEAARAFGEQFQPIFADIIDGTTHLLESFIHASEGTKIFAASLASFSTVVITTTALLGGARLALALFTAATGPFGAAVVGISAALGLLGAAYIAYEAARRAAFETEQKGDLAAEAEANRTVKLINLYERLSEIQDVKNKGGQLTNQVLSEQIRKMDEAIGLLPQFSNELRQIPTDRLDLFLSKLTEINDLLPKGLQNYKTFLQGEAAEARRAAAEAQRQIDALKNRGVTSARLRIGRSDANEESFFGWDEAGQAEEAHKEAERRERHANKQLAEIESERIAESVRVGKIQLQDLETAHNLSLRLENLHQTARQRIWNDGHAHIYQTYQKAKDNLAKLLVSENRLMEIAEHEYLQKVEELTKTHGEKMAKLGLEYKNKTSKEDNEKFNDEVQTLNESLKTQTQIAKGNREKSVIESLEKRTETEKMMKLNEKILDLDLVREELETKRAKRQNEAREVGADDRVTDLQLKMETERDKLLATEIYLMGEVEAHEKKIIELKKDKLFWSTQNTEEARNTNAAVQAAIEDEEAQRDAAQQSLDSKREQANEVIKGQIKDITEATERAIANRVNSEVQMIDKLITEEERLTEAIRKLEEDLAEERVRQRKKVIDAEKEAIRQQEHLNKLEADRHKDIQKRQLLEIKMYREFGENLRKGYSPQAAKALALMKNNVPGIDEQRFNAEQEKKKLQIEDRKKNLLEKEKIEKDEQEALHKEKLVSQGDKARIQREKLQFEIERIRGDLEAIREKSAKSDAADKGKRTDEQNRKLADLEAQEDDVNQRLERIEERSRKLFAGKNPEPKIPTPEEMNKEAEAQQKADEEWAKSPEGKKANAEWDKYAREKKVADARAGRVTGRPKKPLSKLEQNYMDTFPDWTPERLKKAIRYEREIARKKAGKQAQDKRDNLDDLFEGAAKQTKEDSSWDDLFEGAQNDADDEEMEKALGNKKEPAPPTQMPSIGDVLAKFGSGGMGNLPDIVQTVATEMKSAFDSLLSTLGAAGKSLKEQGDAAIETKTKADAIKGDITQTSADFKRAFSSRGI